MFATLLFDKSGRTHKFYDYAEGTKKLADVIINGEAMKTGGSIAVAYKTFEKRLFGVDNYSFNPRDITKIQWWTTSWPNRTNDLTPVFQIAEWIPGSLVPNMLINLKDSYLE